MAKSPLAVLRASAKGLTYQSEIDAPFAVFSWRAKGDLTPERLLTLGGHAAGSPVEVIAPEEFFRGLTEEQGWHGEAEKNDASRFRAMLATLNAHLAGLKVFRVGRAEATYYVVGRTTRGNWAGVTTAALET
jgi:hypothetical protein